MDQYDVLIIEDNRMPAGQNWLLIEHDDGLLFVVRRTALGAQTIADAWAGYRHLAIRGQHEPPTLKAV